MYKQQDLYVMIQAIIHLWGFIYTQFALIYLTWYKTIANVSDIGTKKNSNNNINKNNKSKENGIINSNNSNDNNNNNNKTKYCSLDDFNNFFFNFLLLKKCLCILMFIVQF